MKITFSWHKLMKKSYIRFGNLELLMRTFKIYGKTFGPFHIDELTNTVLLTAYG